MRRSPARVAACFSTALVITAALGASGCGEQTASPAEQGRQVYLAQCIACHASDPAQPGAVGPPVKGSSRQLLEEKILRGTYPPGYTPKRPTTVMPPMPALGPAIPGLAEYLKQSP